MDCAGMADLFLQDNVGEPVGRNDTTVGLKLLAKAHKRHPLIVI